jgi:hypothetical protein
MATIMRIIRDSETWNVNEASQITRPGMTPSGQWLFGGIVRLNNFGNIVQAISFRELRDPDILASIQWLYKNGKPRWHGQDLDHGSYRIWMMPDDLRRIELVA